VCSDIEGYREVVTPDTALTVPPGDVRALVEAAESVLADEPRRVAMGVAARMLAQERYAWPDIAARLEAIYERVVSSATAEARAA
jgi:glycosyltransferase involved in cell wall biosynthesis